MDPFVMQILLAILLVVACMCLLSLDRLLRAKATSVKHGTLSSILEVAEKVVESAVVYTKQTYVDSRKEIAGFLSEEEKGVAYLDTVDLVKAILEPRIFNLLVEYIPEPHAWIATQIEKYVMQHKDSYEIPPVDEEPKIEETIPEKSKDCSIISEAATTFNVSIGTAIVPTEPDGEFTPASVVIEKGDQQKDSSV